MADGAELAGPVQLTARFVLVERYAPPPKPAEGAEAAAEGAEEGPPAIENITFSLAVAEPITVAETSDALSVAFPEPTEEEPEPAAVNWPEAVQWAHVQEIVVDEANSEVEYLQGCCRVAVQNGDEELAAADIDLADFLLGGLTIGRRFEIANLGVVSLDITLDKAWLPEELALRLMPMAITVLSAEALPKDPHSYSALGQAFQPVHCEYQLFDEQPRVETAGLPHSKKVAFKHKHVFHAGKFASGGSLRSVLENGFVVRVHDRQFMPPPAGPDGGGGGDSDGAAAAEGEEGAEGGEEAAAAEEGEEGEGAEAPPPPTAAHLHCGEARIQLTDLLLKATKVKQRANVLMVVNKAKGAPAAPLSAIPRYMEATSTVNVEVCLGFSPAALQDAGAADTISRTYSGPFCRSFYVFKYKDHEFCKALLARITEINAEAMGLPVEHKLDVCAVKPDQPVLTGYQIADGSRRVFFVEGPRASMERLSAGVPRGRANSDSFKILRSDGMGFGERLFAKGTMKLPTIRLFESLSGIMLHPEFLKVIKSKQSEKPPCVDGITRLWTVRRCDYLREIARMELWPTAESIDSVNTFFGDNVNYEDVHGEPKPVKATTKSALETMQQNDEDTADVTSGGGWADGYYSKPVAKWNKWRKLTERTEQLDVGSNDNLYYDTMRRERARAEPTDFNAITKRDVAAVSEHNGSLKPPKPDVSNLIPDDGNVYLYSSQTLNTAELQKEVLRKMVDKPENRDLFFTYSQEYMSLAMCRVNEAEIEQTEKLESQSRWKTKEGFLYPAPKDPREYNKHPKQLSDAAREDLRVPWVENILHPKPVSRDTAFDPNSGKPQWDNILPNGQLFEKNPEFFASVFAPAAMGLTPEQAEELLVAERNREVEIWKSKLVVDSPNFNVYFRNTMRKKVHPLERLETFLKDPAAPKRKALVGTRADPRTKGAIKQAPISMLAGEPYEDPRDFTLDLKKNEPRHNMVPTDFDRMSGLNMKNSLIPHNMHTRPLRGEGNEESRRRILGMGGTIEAIRSEERTSLLFAARISKQGSEKPSVTLPPI